MTSCILRNIHTHLLRGSLIQHRHCVVALVSLFGALGAHVLLVSAAVQPQQFIVLRAQPLSQLIQSRDQFMRLPMKALSVDF